MCRVGGLPWLTQSPLRALVHDLTEYYSMPPGMSTGNITGISHMSLNRMYIQTLMAASTYRPRGRAVDLRLVAIVLAPRAMARLTTHAFQIGSSRCVCEPALAESGGVARKALLILLFADVGQHLKGLGVRAGLPRFVCVRVTHLALSGPQILGAG
jgi:hypothetical protein